MKFGVYFAFFAALVPLFTLVLAEEATEFGPGDEQAKQSYKGALKDNSNRLSLMVVSGVSMYGLCMISHWGHCVYVGVASATGASVVYDLVPKAKNYFDNAEEVEIYQVLRDGLVGLVDGGKHVLSYFHAAIQDEDL
ncbi:hypothetical protein TRVA0_024S00166 [Trichomonascus vanleenenianus]|uniref:uncharacterized protein n=1 Tax=Trichomonascus vanleenenianus TaxID=2268995 RepID=UPI003ECB423F